MSITIESELIKLKVKVWLQVLNEKQIDLSPEPGDNLIKIAIAKYIANINPNDIIILLNLDKYITQTNPDDTDA